MAVRIGLQANVVHECRRLQQVAPLWRQAVEGLQLIEKRQGMAGHAVRMCWVHTIGVEQ